MRTLIFFSFALASCAPTQGSSIPDPDPPTGARIEPSGHATILSAPPLPYPDAPPPMPAIEDGTVQRAREAGISVAEAERRMNPDEETMRAAMALNEQLKLKAQGNYVGVRIVRDPLPRYLFQFRRNAAETLARFTSDPRFGAAEGGVPPEELEPLMQTWIQRMQPDRLVAGGTVRQFEGDIELSIGVSQSEFQTIAARNGWNIPLQIKLIFAREIDESDLVPSDISPFIRTFPRANRFPFLVLSVANSGRIMLRDGCFRLDRDDGESPFVLFGRDTKLARDGEGYLVVQSLNNPETRARIGEIMTWGGYPDPVEDEPGVRAIRAECGNGPIVSVGEPESTRRFRIRPHAIASYAEAKGLTLQEAWDEIKACWASEDARMARLRPREMPSPPPRQCDSIHPEGPPRPPPPRR